MKDIVQIPALGVRAKVHCPGTKSGARTSWIAVMNKDGMKRIEDVCWQISLDSHGENG